MEADREEDIGASRPHSSAPAGWPNANARPASAPAFLSPAFPPSSPVSGCREDDVHVEGTGEEEILFSFLQLCAELPALLSQLVSPARGDSTETERMGATSPVHSGVCPPVATRDPSKAQRSSLPFLDHASHLPPSFASPNSVPPPSLSSFVTPSPAMSCYSSEEPFSSCSPRPFSGSPRLSSLFPPSASRLPPRLLQWAEAAVALAWPCLDTPALHEALLELFLERVTEAFHLHAQRFLWAFADPDSLHMHTSRQLSLRASAGLTASEVTGRSCGHSSSLVSASAPTCCLCSCCSLSSSGSPFTSCCPLSAAFASPAGRGRRSSSFSPCGRMQEKACASAQKSEDFSGVSRRQLAPQEKDEPASGERRHAFSESENLAGGTENGCRARTSTADGEAVDVLAVPGCVAIVPLSSLSSLLLHGFATYALMLDYALELASLLWCCWPSLACAAAGRRQGGHAMDENENFQKQRRKGDPSETKHSERTGRGRINQRRRGRRLQEDRADACRAVAAGGESEVKRAHAAEDEEERDQARYEVYIHRIREAASLAAEAHRPPLAATFVEAFQSLSFTLFSRLRLYGALAPRNKTSEEKGQEQDHRRRPADGDGAGSCQVLPPFRHACTGCAFVSPGVSERKNGGLSSVSSAAFLQEEAVSQCLDCETTSRGIHEYCRLFDQLQARRALAALSSTAWGARTSRSPLEARPRSEGAPCGDTEEEPFLGAASLHLLRLYDPLQGAIHFPCQDVDTGAASEDSDEAETEEGRAVETALPLLYAAVTGAGTSAPLGAAAPRDFSVDGTRGEGLPADETNACGVVSSPDKHPTVGASGGSLDDLLLPLLSFSSRTSEPLRLLLPFLNLLRGSSSSQSPHSSSVASTSVSWFSSAYSSSAQRGSPQSRAAVYLRLLDALSEVRVQQLCKSAPGQPSVLLMPQSAVASGFRAVQGEQEDWDRRSVKEVHEEAAGTAARERRTGRRDGFEGGPCVAGASFPEEVESRKDKFGEKADARRSDRATGDESEKTRDTLHTLPGCCVEGKAFGTFVDAAVEAVAGTGCMYTTEQDAATGGRAGEPPGKRQTCVSCSRCLSDSAGDGKVEGTARNHRDLVDICHPGGRSAGSARRRRSSETQARTIKNSFLPCLVHNAAEPQGAPPVSVASSPSASASSHSFSSSTSPSTLSSPGSISLLCVYLDDSSGSPGSCPNSLSAASPPLASPLFPDRPPALAAALRCLHTSPFFLPSFAHAPDAAAPPSELGAGRFGAFFSLSLSADFFSFLGQESLWRDGLFAVLLRRLREDCLSLDETSAPAFGQRASEDADLSGPSRRNRKNRLGFPLAQSQPESQFQPLLRLLTEHCHPFLHLCWGGLAPFLRSSPLSSDSKTTAPQLGLLSARADAFPVLSGLSGAGVASPFRTQCVCGVCTPAEIAGRPALDVDARQKHLRDLDVGLCSLGVTALLLLREKRLADLATFTHHFPASLPLLADLRAADLLLRCHSYVGAGPALALASFLVPRRRATTSGRRRQGRSERTWGGKTWIEGEKRRSREGGPGSGEAVSENEAQTVFEVPLTADAVGYEFRDVVRKDLVPHFLGLLHARQNRVLERSRWGASLAAQLSAVLGRCSRVEERRKVERLFRFDLGAKEQTRRREEGFLLLSLGTLLAQLLLTLHFLRVSPRTARRVLTPFRRFLLTGLSRRDLETLAFALLPALHGLDLLLAGKKERERDGGKKGDPAAAGNSPSGEEETEETKPEGALASRDHGAEAVGEDDDQIAAQERRCAVVCPSRKRHNGRGIRRGLPRGSAASEAFVQALASDAPGPACLCDLVACAKEKAGLEDEAAGRDAGRTDGDLHNQGAAMDSGGDSLPVVVQTRSRRRRRSEARKSGGVSSACVRRRQGESLRRTSRRNWRGGSGRESRESDSVGDAAGGGHREWLGEIESGPERLEAPTPACPQISLVSASTLGGARRRCSPYGRDQDAASCWSYMVSLNWLARSGPEDCEASMDSSESDEDEHGSFLAERGLLDGPGACASPRACQENERRGERLRPDLGERDGDELAAIGAPPGRRSWPWGGGARGRRRTLIDFYIELVGGPLRFATVYRQRLAQRLADVNFFALVKQAELVNVEAARAKALPPLSADAPLLSGLRSRTAREGRDACTGEAAGEGSEYGSGGVTDFGVSTAAGSSPPMASLLRLYAEARQREATTATASSLAPALLDSHSVPRLLESLASLTDYVDQAVSAHRGDGTFLSLFPSFAATASAEARGDSEDAPPSSLEGREEDEASRSAGSLSSCRIMLSDARTNVQACVLLESNRRQLLELFETKREESRKSLWGETSTLAHPSGSNGKSTRPSDDAGDMEAEWDEEKAEGGEGTPSRRRAPGPRSMYTGDREGGEEPRRGSQGPRGVRRLLRPALVSPACDDLAQTPVRLAPAKASRGRRACSRQRKTRGDELALGEASGERRHAEESERSFDAGEPPAAGDAPEGPRRTSSRSSFCWPGSQSVRLQIRDEDGFVPSPSDAELHALAREDVADPESVFDGLACTPSQMSVRLPSQPQRRRSARAQTFFEDTDEDEGDAAPLSAAGRAGSERLSRSRLSPLRSPLSASSASPTPSRPRRSLRVALRRRTTAGSAGFGVGPFFPQARDRAGAETAGDSPVQRTILGDGARQHGAPATLASAFGAFSRSTSSVASLAVGTAAREVAPASAGVSCPASGPGWAFLREASLSLCLPSLTVCLAALFFWPSPMSPCAPAPAAANGFPGDAGASATGCWGVATRQQPVPQKGEMQCLPLLLRAAERECTRAYQANCHGRWVPEFFHRDSLVEIELSLCGSCSYAAACTCESESRARRAWVSVHQAAILLLLDGQEMEKDGEDAAATGAGNGTSSGSVRFGENQGRELPAPGSAGTSRRDAETDKENGDVASGSERTRSVLRLSAQEIADSLKIEVRHLRRHLKILLVGGWVARARRSALRGEVRDEKSSREAEEKAEGGEGGRSGWTGRARVGRWESCGESRAEARQRTKMEAERGTGGMRGSAGEERQKRGRREREEKDDWVYFLAPEESRPPQPGSPVGGKRVPGAFGAEASAGDGHRGDTGDAAGDARERGKRDGRMPTGHTFGLVSSSEPRAIPHPLWRTEVTSGREGSRRHPSRVPAGVGGAGPSRERGARFEDAMGEAEKRTGQGGADCAEAGEMDADTECEGETFSRLHRGARLPLSGSRSETRARARRSPCASEARPRLAWRHADAFSRETESDRPFASLPPSSPRSEREILDARRRPRRGRERPLHASAADWPRQERRRHSDGETEEYATETEDSFRSGGNCLEATPFACGEDLDLSHPQPLPFSSLPSQRRKRDRGHAVESEAVALWPAREKAMGHLAGFLHDAGSDAGEGERNLHLLSADMIEPRTSTIADFTEGEEDEERLRRHEDSPDKRQSVSQAAAFALGRGPNQELRMGMAALASGVRTQRDEAAERFILEIMRERASNVSNVLHKATPSFVLLARMQQRAKQMNEKKAEDGLEAAEGEGTTQLKSWKHEEILEMLQALEREGRVRKVCGNWELVE
ncbi:conserved hypothetical protein [Neospora caninum Liverpool]|uniref:Uncharacterized protein n=1 Tax=Neospora caninum (strain Liverpool) TaxID=572307 RepID=F0VJ60_NEOCL|nr:conserved hypothetical protein [Neospora caninum Liverpool]CBZ53771.1 conserved hypothetical protein [Neospora caninum Liverpool]CEL67763.1 TPA: hypothetical protein BN1204_035520 [Neospora caninum Liverpool]|eukprot:XP_003883803.1 conserved hypothetical protein [Neospora caninum Liverpool]